MKNKHTNQYRSAKTLSLCLLLFFLLSALQVQASESPASSFYFPRFISAESESSGIAIVNPSAYTASVRLTLTDYVGTQMATAAITLPPREQAALLASQIFAELPIYAGALTVTSDTAGLIASYQAFDSQGTYIDGTGASDASKELIIPVVPGPSEGISEIDFYNGSGHATAVEMQLWSFGGSVLGKSKIQIPANGMYCDLAKNLFPSGTDFSGASHITTASKAINIFSQAQPVSATTFFAGFSSIPAGGNWDMAALNALPASQATTLGVVPYFRTGAHHASTLSLANIESTGVSVTISAIANNGAAIGTRVLNLSPMGGYRAPLQSVISTLGFDEQTGWLLIQSSGRISASLIYGRSDRAAISAAAMQPTPKYEFIFPQLAQLPGLFTEITLVNPNATESHADLYAITPEGTTLGHIQVVVPPIASLTKRIEQIMPEVTNQVGGYIYVRASTPLFSLDSIWSDNGALLTKFDPQDLSTLFIPPVQQSFAVSGTVTLNGAPASGFTVVLSGETGQLTTTNADGFYAFIGLPAGRYSLAVDQFGFQFAPAQTNFEITTASVRQDFVGVTDVNAIVIQPAAMPVGSPDTVLTIFGRDFDSTSQVFAGPVLLAISYIDSARLQAVVPAFIMANPAQYDIYVVTNPSGANRKTSQPASFFAFQDKPILTSIKAPSDLVEGLVGASISLTGSGFLKGATVLVNSSSNGIIADLVDSKHITAFLPAAYFQKGGIYPVIVRNPYPSNTESNIQLLTIYYPAPEIQGISPASVSTRLESGAAPLALEVFGFGFKRGAVVMFNNTVLPTWYCESDAYCLNTHLYASVSADLLTESGFAEIKVKNPNPSLANSGIKYLSISGLQPTITTAVPGNATVTPSSVEYDMPVVVTGTNFGPQTLVRVYKFEAEEVPDFEPPAELLSSTQLVANITVQYPDALGIWNVEVFNPPPGGGTSKIVSFILTEAQFERTPFLVSMMPSLVAAGGPSFTLIVNGTNFVSGAQIQFNTTYLPTTVVSSKQARAEVPAALIDTAGKVPVRLINPGDGGASNRLYMDIR
jgi:hypothetical protein